MGLNVEYLNQNMFSCFVCSTGSFLKHLCDAFGCRINTLLESVWVSIGIFGRNDKVVTFTFDYILEHCLRNQFLLYIY